MTPARTQEAIDQGNIDWAHSIQARHAEHVMGKLARQSDGEPMASDHRDRLLRAAVEGGSDPATTAAMLDRPAIPKLMEFDEPDVRRSSTALVDMLVETIGNSTNPR